MRRFLVPLTLVPAALAAQAPAPSLADQYKAQSPAIQALQKTDPAAALAKAEALIPAVPPLFDKTDFSKAQGSMGEYNALTALYRTAAACAIEGGQWEKARDYAGKAKANAQATYDNCVPPLTAFQDSWKKAQVEAQKNLDEEAVLVKTEQPTAEQIKRMEYLQIREDTYKSNIANGKKMVDAVDARLKDQKDQTGDFDAFIQSTDLRLKEESGNLAKFKGDKKAYAAAALKTADGIKDKEAELAYVRRLQVLDPSSKAVARKLDVLTGKATEPVVKRVHKKKVN